MADKRIVGAIGVGDKTFYAGDEAAMEAHIAATGATVDWDRLEAKGVVSGYGQVPATDDTERETAHAPKAKAAKKAARRR